MRTTRLSEQIDTQAPDGSEVRFLLRMNRGELNHFTLPVGATSSAVVHQTIEEVWYFLSGSGQFWRSDGRREETVDVCAGVCLDIPTDTRFQFRNTGDEPLCFVVATMPPWPGAQEAVAVEGLWTAS